VLIMERDPWGLWKGLKFVEPDEFELELAKTRATYALLQLDIPKTKIDLLKHPDSWEGVVWSAARDRGQSGLSQDPLKRRVKSPKEPQGPEEGASTARFRDEG